ncbi:hypothetical protein ACFL6Y_11530 [Elusimicrobiota bacterium]
MKKILFSLSVFLMFLSSSALAEKSNYHPGDKKNCPPRFHPYLDATGEFAFPPIDIRAAKKAAEALERAKASIFEMGNVVSYRDIGNRRGNNEYLQKCKSSYENLFDDNTLKIDIFYGYMDHMESYEPDEDYAKHARFGVVDQFHREALAKRLLFPCPSREFFACGFRRASSPLEDADKLTKRIRGPDGAYKYVEITIMNAAFSPSDKANNPYFIRSLLGLVKCSKQQRAKSAEIAEAFLESLETADVVLYTAHSRSGRGLAFYPIPAKTNEPASWRITGGDIDTYLDKRKMFKTLRSGSPKLFGLYSCSTKENYGMDIFDKTHGGTGLILTNDKSDFRDSTKNIYITLNSILGLQCGLGTQKAMNSNLTMPDTGYRIYGFGGFGFDGLE